MTKRKKSGAIKSPASQPTTSEPGTFVNDFTAPQGARADYSLRQALLTSAKGETMGYYAKAHDDSSAQAVRSL